jgi:hypothetical protein
MISERHGNICTVTGRNTVRYEYLPSRSRNSGGIVPTPGRLHRTVGSLWNTAAKLSEAPDCSAMGWAALVPSCLLVPVGKDLQHVQVGYTYCTDQSESESESESLYDWRLSPISSSSRQAPWDSRPETFFRLNTCSHSSYVTSSLTRRRVCRLQLLLALASAFILRSESRGTHDHILLSQIRDSPTLEGQVPVFTSLRNRVAQLYTQALGSLFVCF